MPDNEEDDGLELPPLSPEEEAILRDIDVSDLWSTQEALQLSSGLTEDQIKRRALANEADRTERFRDHFETLALITLYFVWVVLILIGIAWVYHLLAPPCWPRLPDEQVKHLHSLVTGGILAAIAGGHLKRRLGD